MTTASFAIDAVRRLTAFYNIDNAGVLLHNWCVGRTLLLIMRRYSFGIVFLTIPPNAGIPLIMRGYSFGSVSFLTAKAVGSPSHA